MSQFFKNIIALGGKNGKQWLDSLPSLVDLLTHQWNLSELIPFKNLTYNYVLKGHRKNDKTPIVLKLIFSSQEMNTEAAALKIYRSHGSVKLLDYDGSKNALLLEYVNPGVSLKSLFPEYDNIAVHHAAHVIKKLHKQAGTTSEKFPTLQKHLKALFETTNTILPRHHLEKAKACAVDLLETQPFTVLLHGDLHHDNIVSSEQYGWVAIDPKGIVGDPGYEPASFIINPLHSPQEQQGIKKIVSDRIDQFSSLLTYDKQRIRNWAYVHAILSACWSLEDATSWKHSIAYAEIIDGIRV